MYDAEGLISIDDYLLIFTKNRAKKIKGSNPIIKLTSFDKQLVGQSQKIVEERVYHNYTPVSSFYF